MAERSTGVSEWREEKKNNGRGRKEYIGGGHLRRLKGKVKKFGNKVAPERERKGRTLQRITTSGEIKKQGFSLEQSKKKKKQQKNKRNK